MNLKLGDCVQLVYTCEVLDYLRHHKLEHPEYGIIDSDFPDFSDSFIVQWFRADHSYIKTFPALAKVLRLSPLDLLEDAHDV